MSFVETGPDKKFKSDKIDPEKEGDRIIFGYDTNSKTFSSKEVNKILETHDIRGMERLRDLTGVTREQIELYSQYAILRKSTLNDMRPALEKRRQENNKKTKEEERLGIFIEQLEPQVRDAVLKLQAKGYRTYESGFHSESGAGQIIRFQKKYFQNTESFKEIKNDLQKEGIGLEIESDHLKLAFNKLYSLDEMGRIWDRVADALPQLSK